MSMRLAVFALTLATVAVTALAGEPGRRPAVVVELFTSEGCSSCPPADKVLKILHEKQPIAGVEIIALSEHVDYWNRLGWEDPFSSAQFTERQQRYSAGWPLRIYTPQMVIDGTVERLGSDGKAIVEALRAAKTSEKAPVAIELDGDRVAVTVGELPRPRNARVWLALVEDGLSTDVARGENKGRTLEHVGVVRRLVEIGEIRRGRRFETTAPLESDPAWGVDRVAVFVQEIDSRQVVGAAQARFAGR